MATFGIFRGIVVNSTDPERRGRIKVRVPQLLGGYETDWAWPCVPVGTTQASIPAPGKGVWVQFEGGDLQNPVWMGGWEVTYNA